MKKPHTLLLQVFVSFSPTNLLRSEAVEVRMEWRPDFTFNKRPRTRFCEQTKELILSESIGKFRGERKTNILQRSRRYCSAQRKGKMGLGV
jgi:hypothetical protein